MTEKVEIYKFSPDGNLESYTEIFRFNSDDDDIVQESSSSITESTSTGSSNSSNGSGSGSPSGSGSFGLFSSLRGSSVEESGFELGSVSAPEA